MSNKKIEEYETKYGNIPKLFNERFLYLMQILNIKESDIIKLRKSIKRITSIKHKELRFIFYFTPQATPRPRYSRFSKVFYVKNALNYNEIFGKFIESCEDINFKIITPCTFECKTFAPIPEQMSKNDKMLAELSLLANISKPDWDNLGKTYSDMVQKHLILDDSLIYKGTVEKAYSIKPRIEITIKYLNDFDCKYNERKVKNWSVNK
jgi:Holliday junction resolvase RusA-like endonuclease